MVALDSHDTVEDMAKLRRFRGVLGVEYPVGVETTDTYRQLTRRFEGLNPFPVNVVVGKDGRIAYIAREYDPEALTAAIEAELAR